MRLPIRPAPLALYLLGAGFVLVLLLRLSGVPVEATMGLAWGVLAIVLLATLLDGVHSRRAWRADAVTLRRRLPAAFAVGARKPVTLVLENAGRRPWTVQIFDGIDQQLEPDGLPLDATLPPSAAVETTYTVLPLRRGPVQFTAAHLRVRSRWRLCELLERLGPVDARRVYPDFAQIARYAWLAGDHRLQEIGIKTYQQRGEGTDFKQLAEYRPGDPVRHIDWKATMRLDKPIIREFQDERDQHVLLLIDCGRRMRADDRTSGIGTSHFDQVLNAVMLLSYVALRQGDAVGALTFGTPPEEARVSPPRKGTTALNALMGELYGVQPTPTHSDYVAAAQEVIRRQPRRALVVIITNFRDEDSDELGQALRLLRSRHLVLLASLRERIVGELIGQRITRGEAAIDIASAHLYEQARRDAFSRLAGRDALMVDAEPQRLGIELVNRYHAAKRSGLI